MEFSQTVERCRRLIAEGGDFSAPYRIQGPGTFPLNLDVRGNAAAVTFLTAGAAGSRFYVQTFVLQRIHGIWEYLGGGGSSCEDFPDRCPSTAQFGRQLLVSRRGQTRKRRAPFIGSRWISVGHVRVSTEITTLYADDRPIPIPPHGHVSVLWTTRRGPTLRAWSGVGELLTTMRLSYSMSTFIDPDAH